MKRKNRFLSITFGIMLCCISAVMLYFALGDYVAYQISNIVTLAAEQKADVKEKISYTENNSDPLGIDCDFDVITDKYGSVIADIEKGYKSYQSSVDIANYNLTENEFYQIIDYLGMCHGYYYVQSGYSYTYVGNHVLEYRPEYLRSAKEVEKINVQIEEAVNGIAEEAASFKTDIEKLIYIHDYLVSTVSCEDENVENNIYGALVLKNTLCVGYSEAFCQIALKLGIKCWIVTSNELNHAWNMVLLNGRYYFVDCTWDDPVLSPPSLITNPVSSYGKYRYFMCSGDYFYNNGHNSKDWLVNGINVSEISSSKFYDDFFWRDYETLMIPLSGSWYHSYGYETENPAPNLVKFSIDKITFSNNENYTLNTERTVYSCWNTGNSYYPAFYSTLQSYNGALYYMRADGVYKLNSGADYSGKKDPCVFKNPRNDNIYDFVIDGNDQTFTVMYGKTIELDSSNAQQISYNISDYKF